MAQRYNIVDQELDDEPAAALGPFLAFFSA